MGLDGIVAYGKAPPMPLNNAQRHLPHREAARRGLMLVRLHELCLDVRW